MADLPAHGQIVQKEDKKQVPLTLQEQVNLLRQDILELARGVNTQARLLEAIVTASETITQTYVEITRTPAERGVQTDEPPKNETK